MNSEEDTDRTDRPKSHRQLFDSLKIASLSMFAGAIAGVLAYLSKLAMSLDMLDPAVFLDPVLIWVVGLGFATFLISMAAMKVIKGHSKEGASIDDVVKERFVMALERANLRTAPRVIRDE